MERDTARKPGKRRRATPPVRKHPHLLGITRFDPREVVGTYVNYVRDAEPMAIVELERAGVPSALIKGIGQEFRMSKTQVFQILGASRATIARKGAKEIVGGSVGQATLAMVKLLALAQRIVGNSLAPEAKEFDVGAWLGKWVETPQPALGGRRPSELLDTPTGQQLVVQVLGAIESTSYQ